MEHAKEAFGLLFAAIALCFVCGLVNANRFMDSPDEENNFPLGTCCFCLISLFSCIALILSSVFVAAFRYNEKDFWPKY